MAVKFPEHITLDEAWGILSSAFEGYSEKFKTKLEISAALEIS